MLRGALDRLWGRGAHAVTIPPMDGALRPNTRLDEAPMVLERSGLDDVARLDSLPVMSCGDRVLGLQGQELHRAAAPILALATLQAGGVALANALGQIEIVGAQSAAAMLPEAARHVTAMSQLADGALCITVGSAVHSPEHWRRDLLEKRAAGAVWRVPLDGSAPECLADGIGWAAGCVQLGDQLLVSEAWNARIVALPLAGGPSAAWVDHLPAYPGRLASDGQGGVWACLFAPRRQLVEFVLREDRYRQAMLKEVPEPHWIAPSYRTGASFLEPLQQGGVKQLGVLKPWAPSFSYGLLVRLDAQGRPRESLHSRADGRRHGVSACLADGSDVMFVARGDGVCARAGGLQ